MKRKSKTKKSQCISPNQIIFWTVAGYAAYTALLYWQRKPACEYAAQLCAQVNQR